LYRSCNVAENVNYTFQTTRFFTVTPEKRVIEITVNTKLPDSNEWGAGDISTFGHIPSSSVRVVIFPAP